jgi:hypothetical protein
LSLVPGGLSSKAPHWAQLFAAALTFLGGMSHGLLIATHSPRSVLTKADPNSRCPQGNFLILILDEIQVSCTGEFVHPNMIYFMNIHANMRRLSVGAALSEAGSQYSAQHWSRSLESSLRVAVCKPKTLFETSHVAVAFASSK